ncbi:MAG: hypothetical protein Q8R92_18800, partial [Deltaproteobacteria bacterium]|nr:hypothetical protein [Deltaproteobacteria bacterium]
MSKNLLLLGCGGGTAAAYSQNLVDNQATACLTTTALTGAADSQYLTFSGWFDFVSDSGTTNMFEVNGRSLIKRLNTEIRFFIRNTAAETLYDALTPAVAAADGLTHIHFKGDFATTPVVVVTIDGVDVTGSMTVTTAATAGTIDHTRASYGILSTGAGGVPVDVEQVGDIFIDFTAALDASSFISGGLPLDLTGVGSPIVWLGNDMTADERGGNASEGWNDGHNLG